MIVAGAIIFDLDGVISDTQDLHATVESSILQKSNIRLTPDEITARFAGTGDRTMFTTVFAEHKIKDVSIEDAIREKWLMMEKAIETNGLQPMPYALELIEYLFGNNFMLSIASGSPKRFLDKVVETLSLEEHFHCWISSEEVAKGKPSPDVFLEAAKRMNFETGQCVVIEDGMSGMQAAANAGMACVGLVKDTNKNYPADFLVNSLRDITPALIRQLADSKKSASRAIAR